MTVQDLVWSPMFFLFRALGSGNSRRARIGAVVLIAALIVVRVVLVSRHGASSDIGLAVIVGLILVRVVLVGRRRMIRTQAQRPPTTDPWTTPPADQ